MTRFFIVSVEFSTSITWACLCPKEMNGLLKSLPSPHPSFSLNVQVQVVLSAVHSENHQLRIQGLKIWQANSSSCSHVTSYPPSSPQTSQTGNSSSHEHPINGLDSSNPSATSSSGAFPAPAPANVKPLLPPYAFTLYSSDARTLAAEQVTTILFNYLFYGLHPPTRTEQKIPIDDDVPMF